MANDIVDFLKEVLTDKELERLRSINEIKDQDNRHTSLRNFFHLESIYFKVRDIADPAWISYDIFIKGKQYEF